MKSSNPHGRLAIAVLMTIGSASAQYAEHATDGAMIETIAVNRFGSMCHPRSSVPTHSTSSASSPSIPSFTSSPPSISTLSTSSSNTASSSVSAIPTPQPYGTNTRCTDPVCPLLDHDACLSVQGSTYGIICDSALTGLQAFPPRAKRDDGSESDSESDVEAEGETGLQKRKYTPTFTACLGLCDLMGGCHGVSWSPQIDGSAGGNCLVYGGVTGVVAGRNGTIAARRLATYGGTGTGAGAYGGGGYQGGAVYSAGAV
ncbi:hypothetical protein LTR17_005193 [Elasticomyces elasticus]|nr:hypothetical protein LTR17_005193 [Elasticomyces elasticus]